MVGRPTRRCPWPAGAIPSCLLVAALLAMPWLSTSACRAAGRLSRRATGRTIRPWPTRMLHDVTFVDAQQGWAVGDRGVIWHTADGGHHWELQTSGVDCPLRPSSLSTLSMAWRRAARPGRSAMRSHGVWLETRDGGEHWRVDRNLLLAHGADDQIFRSLSTAGR